ncbi:MAG: DUF86 domain-containing protein [Clostridia bacterium]|nr:DUF86 domain-containing protein [Clostridia bacterium]MBR4049678.1 DUF86 domain-containing protein [Clostridia bacterium]
MKNKKIISKMIGYIDKISSYCDGIGYSDFEENSLLVEACVFNLSQLGELVNKLDADFISGNKSVPWNQMRGLRNRIVHDYEGVNLVLVWEIISGDLAELKVQLEAIQ